MTSAQFTSAGDVLTRTADDGTEYEFRVRRGGNRDSSDNAVVYLGDPTERPVDADVYFAMERNEATIMWYDAGDGLETFSNETHIE